MFNIRYTEWMEKKETLIVTTLIEPISGFILKYKSNGGGNRKRKIYLKVLTQFVYFG